MKNVLYSFSLLLAFSFLSAQTGAGYALDYSGVAGYVEVPYSSSLNPTSNLSVEAWVYPTSYGSNLWRNTIVSTDSWSSSNGEEGYVLRCGASGTLSFNIATTTGWKEATSTIFMGTNQWYHVAGTFDGSTIKVYINGVLAGSQAYSGSIKVATHNLRIGEMIETTQSRAFEGAIDEVRIWGKALTQAEIREHMCRKLAGSNSDLLACYRFDAGSGNSISDHSGNNHTGTLSATNKPSWITSEAIIGDTSVYLYPSGGWAGTQLNLASPYQDSMTLNNFTGNPSGAQLVWINGAPVDNTYPSSYYLGLDDHHWGIMVIGGSAAQCIIKYSYAGYPGINKPSALDMAHNEGSGWQPGNMILVSNTLQYGTKDTRKLVLMTKSPQLPFKLLSPADSTSVTIQGVSSQTLDFAWQTLQINSTPTYEFLLDLKTGNFANPLLKSLSGNSGTDTSFSITYHTLDSVMGSAGFQVGDQSYFKWTVRDTNTNIYVDKTFYLHLKRGVLGLRDIPVLEGIVTFPTVVNDGFINIRNQDPGPRQIHVEIMDPAGRILLSENMSLLAGHTTKVDLKLVSPGHYMLKITDGKKTLLERIAVN